MFFLSDKSSTLEEIFLRLEEFVVTISIYHFFLGVISLTAENAVITKTLISSRTSIPPLFWPSILQAEQPLLCRQHALITTTSSAAPRKIQPAGRDKDDTGTEGRGGRGVVTNTAPVRISNRECMDRGERIPGSRVTLPPFPC